MKGDAGPTADRRGSSGTFLPLLITELRRLVRDRRAIFASVVLPALVLPLFFLASSQGEERRERRLEKQVFDYVVIGQEAELLRQLLAETELNRAEIDGASSIDPNPTGGDAGASDGVSGEGEATADPTITDPVSPGEDAGHGGPDIQLREVEIEAPRRALEERRLHAVVEALTASEAAALRAERRREEGDEASGGADSADLAIASGPSVPLFRILFLADWHASQTAAGALEDRLGRARQALRASALEGIGFPVRVERMAANDERLDVASARERTGDRLGRSAVFFIVLFVVIGGSLVAADTLAGEKERGTLETLLTTAAHRGEIIAAKMSAIAAVGLFIALFQLVNLGVYVGLNLIDLSPDFEVHLTSGTFLWLLLLLAPLIGLIAAALLWLSGRSHGYKAFQVNLLPVLLLLLAPALASLLPGLALRSAVVAIPIANVAVAVREVLAGRFDVPMLTAAVLLSTAAASLLIRAAWRDLGNERLVTATPRDEVDLAGGAAVFPRHVLRWFAAMWVLIFLAITNLGALADLRTQVLFNLVGVFLGASLLMMRLYRLDPKKVLPTRRVGAAVWLAVLLGAPATYVVGVAVGRLSSWLFPLPQELVQAFSQGLLPQEMGLFELLFLIAILPGFCEEVAFRGVLLYGLRRRLPPVALCLVVGVIFALFHMQWLRLLPTFFLGTLLSALTLMTGSLLPAIVWHILNNAAAIVTSRAGLDMTALAPEVYLAAGLASALAWVLLWRCRHRGEPAGSNRSQAE